MASRMLTRTLATVLSLTLLAAACSSSEDGSATDDDPTSDEVAGDTSADNQDEGAGDEVGSSEEVNTGGIQRREPTDPSAFDSEPADSALRGDRNNPAFPPPLVDVSDIRSGGPPPDGIPPIDLPVFAPVSETDYLTDSEGVVVVEIDGEARAYPIQILIWHEIVNDTIGDVPVTVTFCPLCNSSLVFHRQYGSRVLDFGTSGELFQSALVMYDRQTESLWAHFTGEGLVGHFAGAQLELIPAQTLAYADFAKLHPDGLVMTLETGYDRSYGLNPYVGYDDEATGPFGAFISEEIDDRLVDKARVVGVLAPSGPFTLTLDDLIETGVYHFDDDSSEQDEPVADPIVVFHQSGLSSALESGRVDGGRDVGQTGAFFSTADDGTSLTFVLADDGETFVDSETGSTWSITGTAIAGEREGEQLEAIPHLDTFWFAWSTYRPEAVLIQ